MPIIGPPPEYEEPQKEEIKIESVSSERMAHFERFFMAKPKICGCGLTNHGWNKRCYCGRVWDENIRS